MRGHRGLERCAGGHMEADEWERTACGEIKREKHFWGEKFVSPLGLCCFFLAALAVFFRSPLVSLTLLLLPPAWEDWKTGYVSDYWSVFLAAAGLGHNVFYSRLTDGFISCAFVLGLYGLLFLLAKHAMGRETYFFQVRLHYGLRRFPYRFSCFFPLPPRLLQAWCFFSLAECPAGRGFLSARSSRWEVWRRMARKYFSFRSFHRGTILFEALLVSVILSLAALAVIPLYTGWWSEKRLELAAEEVASAIRQVEILAKNESADYPSMSEGLTFFCETMTDGTERYYTRKGTERVNPKGYLPKGIRVDGGKASLRFRKDGFAGTGEEYNIFLTTDNGKYGRMITVAMYTGRVRVRKIK